MKVWKKCSSTQKRSIVNVTFCVAFSLTKDTQKILLRQIKKGLKNLFSSSYTAKDFCGKPKQDFVSRYAYFASWSWVGDNCPHAIFEDFLEVYKQTDRQLNLHNMQIKMQFEQFWNSNHLIAVVYLLMRFGTKLRLEIDDLIKMQFVFLKLMFSHMLYLVFALKNGTEKLGKSVREMMRWAK